MTFRTWLGRQLRDLLTEPPAPAPNVNGSTDPSHTEWPPPPTPSPESTPPSPTSSSRSSAPSSVDPAMLVQLAEMMQRQQTAMMQEMRGMVLDILQGRERPPLTEEDQVTVQRQRYDPPDYDNPGMEDLPTSLQNVFLREEQEDVEFRTQLTEPELLRQQLERQRAAAGLDPTGPTSVPSFSTESLGLQWEEPGTVPPPMPG